MNEQEESRIFTEELTVAWQRYCDECNLEKNNIVDYGFWLQNEFALHLWLSNRSLREKVERLDKLTKLHQSETAKKDCGELFDDAVKMCEERNAQIKELEEKIGAVTAQRDLFAGAILSDKVWRFCSTVNEYCRYCNEHIRTGTLTHKPDCIVIAAQSLQGKVNG